MAMSKLFWVLIIVTVGVFGLNVNGAEVFELLVLMILIDLIVLKLSAEKSADRAVREGLESLKGSLSSLEGIVKSFDVKPTGDVTLGRIQEGLDGHTSELKGELNASLDRMATKSVDIENRLHQMKRGFSAAIAAFDDRLRALESVPDEEFEFEDDEF